MTDEPQAPLLSVVVPTYNRRAGLERLLAAHAEAHGDADDLVVVGPMSPPTDCARSVWVRWEERQLLKQYAAMERGAYPCTPRQFYTGNASVTRNRMLAAGGFDARFKR